MKEIDSRDILSYYENEAEEVPIFGSLREISLAENIMDALPSKPLSIIDIGCGEGYVIYRIRKKFPALPLYGFDLTQGRIAVTKSHVPDAHLLRGDVLSLPFPDNTFDVVICSELLEHMADYQKTVQELLRITKRQLIITVPNELHLIQVMCPKCKTKHYLDGHVNFFTQKKLADLFTSLPHVKILELFRFHSIFTYNRVTMKLPLFLRLFIDRHFLKLHKYIGFLKPNFLLVSLKKKNLSTDKEEQG